MLEGLIGTFLVLIPLMIPDYAQSYEGWATWYDAPDGALMKGGERYDREGYTCAVPHELWPELKGKKVLIVMAEEGVPSWESRQVALEVADTGWLTEAGTKEGLPYMADMPVEIFERYFGPKGMGRFHALVLVLEGT